jgi:hypothetical protein
MGAISALFSVTDSSKYNQFLNALTTSNSGMVKAINEGKYDDILEKLKGMDEKELRKLYEERETEPLATGEDWRPKDKRYLEEAR